MFGKSFRLVVLGLMSATVWAQGVERAPQGFAGAKPTGWEGRKESLRKRFEQIKALESESHRERIRILQEAEACIDSATTPDAYRQCEEREKIARQELRERLQRQREALRQMSLGPRF
ncbi:MAG: hypothetical protein N2441_05145 [Rhodocyclaceae bacterium]|nr:hypothetical protein [Rhodocyclaceae bacterium]